MPIAQSDVMLICGREREREAYPVKVFHGFDECPPPCPDLHKHTNHFRSSSVSRVFFIVSFSMRFY